MLYTGTCPHCGAIVRGGHGSPMKRIGSPIMLCPRCKKPYIDNNMYEWAVLQWPYKLWYYFFANNRFFLWLFIVPLAFNYPTFWICLPILWMLGCITWVHIASDEAISESEERCTDIAYIDLLCAAGYDKIRSDVVLASKKRHAEAEKKRAETLSEQAVRSEPSQSNVAPSYRVCRFIWTSVIIFKNHLGISFSLEEQAYLWAAFFYVVTKTVRNQAVVDEIYSGFFDSVRFLLRNHPDKFTAVTSVMAAYRQLRPQLNSSGIDPRTSKGMDSLWEFICQRINRNGIWPTDAKDSFKGAAQIVLRYAQKAYGITEDSSSSSKNNTRYSLCEREAVCVVPDFQRIKDPV